MAVCRSQYIHTLSGLFGQSYRWNGSGRLYSQYPKTFVEPVFVKDDIEKLLKEKHILDVKTTPVRAARNDQHCSVFYDKDICKFINYVMREGKKEVARDVVERALTKIKHIQLRKYNDTKDVKEKEEIILNPREIFHAAVENVMPKLNVTKIKKSGTWYSVPVGITPELAKIKAMKWIVEVSKDKKSNIRFYDVLAEELLLASKGEGRAHKKKVDLHKLCENNRSFAHYKWT